MWLHQYAASSVCICYNLPCPDQAGNQIWGWPPEPWYHWLWQLLGTFRRWVVWWESSAGQAYRKHGSPCQSPGYSPLLAIFVRPSLVCAHKTDKSLVSDYTMWILLMKWLSAGSVQCQTWHALKDARLFSAVYLPLSMRCVCSFPLLHCSNEARHRLCNSTLAALQSAGFHMIAILGWWN